MFEILPAAGGGYFWTLKGDNGETLCHSEVYTTKRAAQKGIRAVKSLFRARWCDWPGSESPQVTLRA